MQVDKGNVYQNTPLLLAVYKGHIPVIKTLLEYGANPNSANKDGITPLKLAQKNPQILTLLQEAKPKNVDTTHEQTVKSQEEKDGNK